MLTFKKKYFLIALFVFIVEVLIALYVKDRFIRPFFGDFLAVIFVYTLLKSFLKISVKSGAIITLIIAYVLEFAQYFQLIEILGLKHIKVLRIVLGSSFDWLDMLAYTLGVFFILGAEIWGQKRRG